MKTRNLLFACLLLAGFTACKKDKQKTVENTPDNSLSFTLDGKAYNGAILVLSKTTVTDGQDESKLDSAYFITALTDSSATSAQIVLSMTFEQGKVLPGNYSDTAYASDGISWTPVIGGDGYFQSSIQNYSVIQLTRADGAYLEGTFKGQIVSVNDAQKISTVANGKFKINTQTVATNL